MILKQLKQLTLSATRRNAHLLRIPRLYSSPAVSQSLTTSKPSKRLSKDDRRVVVESFVTKYRAANAGKFPTLKATVKEVGGGYYVVRDIYQELKLRPNAPVSRVPASAANDDASSLKQDHTIESSHPSSDEVSIQGDNNLVITATHDRSETEAASLDKDVDSKCDSDTQLPESQPLMVSEEFLKNSETEEDGTLDHLEAKSDNPEGVTVLPTETTYQYNVTTATHDKRETETDSKDVVSKCDSDAQLPENQTLKVAEECLKNSEPKDEGTLTQLVSPETKAGHLEGASVLPATHENIETETAAPNDDTDSKCDATTHLPGSQPLMLSEEECLKNSESKEEGKLAHLGSQEPKADQIEGAVDSANVLPSETRQVAEKGDGEVKPEENSSAWSNIISFAKGFANFWRKG
ncbi:unnamed protein product [Eruca vesicaria subsp. sativa]|uniref:AT3G52170-like helix-turn-helix domain-containing protein n=1 Tax=Eruca vesicaria subsp. sativa TaxID=29727 RepID=A0ABC8LTJ3_ERUVS|nr:unnamed protein product [Eruca vesicaria subsp. sativa]